MPLEEYARPTLLTVGERGKPRHHHRSIEFWNSPKNVALREKAKEVERHARAKYGEAKEFIKSANEAKDVAAKYRAIGDLRSNTRAVNATGRRILLLRGAVTSLEEAARSDPVSHLYPLARGECLNQLGLTSHGDAGAAKEAFTLALSLAPKDDHVDAVNARRRALVGRAAAHRALDNLQSALQDLDDARALDPPPPTEGSSSYGYQNNRPSHHVRIFSAQLLQGTGRHEEAVRCYIEGITLIEEQHGQGCDAVFQPLVELAACERTLSAMYDGKASEEQEEEERSSMSGSSSRSSRSSQSSRRRGKGDDDDGDDGSSTHGGDDEDEDEDDDEAKEAKDEEDEETKIPKTWLERSIEHLQWAVQVRRDNIPAAVDLGMALLAAGRFKAGGHTTF